MDKWIVVFFEQFNSVEAVPQKWYYPLTKNLCYPPEDVYNSKRILDLIKRQEPAEENWPVYNVKLLGKEYDSYNKASEKAKKALQNDDLSSSTDISMGRGKRQVKRKHIFTSSSEDEECGIMPFPTPASSQKVTLMAQTVKPKPTLSQRMDGNPIHKNKKYNIVRQEQDDGTSISQRIHGTSTQTVNNISNQHSAGSFQQRNREFGHQVLRQLMVINTKLPQQGENLQLLLDRVDMQPLNPEEVEIEPFLALIPIKNLENLSLIEDLLQENNAIDILAKEFSRIGGSDSKLLTKRVMYRLLSNELGMLYSFEGAKGKRTFKDLNIYKVIQKAVRLNRRTSTACDDEIISSIKSWLVQASNRINHRNRREAQEQENNNRRAEGI